MFTQQRSIIGINVARLIIQQTGTYNDLYLRPYETNLQAYELNNVMNVVHDAGIGGKVNGTVLAGALGTMVQPSATPGQQVGITNGWSGKRCRFVMEVHVKFNTGSEVIYYFQGYTDHYGVSLQGSLDPNMVFTINSFMAVNRLNQLTPAGVVTRDIVVDTGHLLTNDMYQSPFAGPGQYMMRPQDIFRGIKNAYHENTANLYDTVSIVDTSNMLRRDPSKSARSNNMPTTFVAKVINGYQMASAHAEFGQSNHDIYDRARADVNESHVSDNPFIRAVSDVGPGGITNRFTFSNLEAVDRNARHVTNFISLGTAQQAQLHQAGSTAYWTDSTRETVVATILSQAVPTLMMELMIHKVQIFSHNHDVTGVMDTKLVNPVGLSNADMTRQFELFKNRLEREVLFNITFGNYERYTLNMRADLFDDTWIELSLNSQPPIVFNVPSFADGLFTPVVTNSREHYNNIVHDFETLLSNIGDAVKPAAAPVNSMI